MRKDNNQKPKAKLNPNGRIYKQEKIRTALDFCPPINPCPTCGYPVIQGYCCVYCGESDPRPK